MVASSSRSKENSYFVTEIVGVQAYDKPYICEGTKIYNTLILKHANLVREYKILYVSNQKFEENEFLNWKNKMTAEIERL